MAGRDRSWRDHMFRTFLVLLVLLAAPISRAQAEPSEASPYTRTVHFEFKSADAKAAFLCGNMTQWDCSRLPMRRTGAGVFYINAPLTPGRIEYVFVVDGERLLDETSMTEDDGHGGQRSWFVLDDDRDAQPQLGIPHGTVAQRTLPSKALGDERIVNVYTPPGYSKKKTYPLLILLHGYGMNESQWLTGGIQHYLDRYIAANILEPVIVVMPGTPDDFYMGKSEDYIINELYPWTAREYPIRGGNGVAAIGGMSMGGFGAFYLAYRHPELFGHAMVLSPGNLDQAFLDELDRDLERGSKVSANLDIRVGKNDEISFPYAERLTQILAARDVPFDYEVARGIHDWNYWHSVMKPSLVRLQEFFNRTP
jgi:enterochelin esterase-like enzyme